MRGATVVGLGGMAAHLVIKADGQIVRQLGPEKCVNSRLGAVGVEVCSLCTTECVVTSSWHARSTTMPCAAAAASARRISV